MDDVPARIWAETKHGVLTGLCHGNAARPLCEGDTAFVREAGIVEPMAEALRASIHAAAGGAGVVDKARAAVLRREALRAYDEAKGENK